MISCMALEYVIILKVVSIKDFGKMGRQMVKEPIVGRQAKPDSVGTLLKIELQVKEF